MSMLYYLTVDDFDPLVSYSNYDDWVTPNPQDNPTWYNATPDVTNSPWHQATYHTTSVVGAEASFNFTGTQLMVYGATGANANYTISLDKSLPQPFTTTLSTANATSGRTLLYNTTELTNAAHELVITNNGDGLLLDLIVVGIALGGDGATLTNTTVDDRDPSVTYTGAWTQQTGPNFFDQTSTYTGGPGGALQVNFSGSAVYVYGDQVNDHGPFSVYLNDSWAATHTGRSGCGGGFAKACEKLHGLAFWAGGLPEGQHTLRLVNEGPSSGNTTFFDFDMLEYTTPSVYAAAQGKAGDCPFTQCDGGTSAGTATATASSGSAPASTSKGNGAAATTEANLALAAVLGAWVLKFVH